MDPNTGVSPITGVANPIITLAANTTAQTYTVDFSYTLEGQPSQQGSTGFCHQSKIAIRKSNTPLSIDKNISTVTATAGALVSYTIRVCNNCQAAIPNVNITDVLPAGLLFVSADNNLVFNSNNNSLTTTISSLQGNSCQLYTIQAQVVTDASCNNNSRIINTAQATAQSNTNLSVSDTASLVVRNDTGSCTPAAYTINFAQAQQAGVLQPSGTTGQTVIISGTWRLNAGVYTFLNSNIIMKPGAQIIVENGATLQLINSNIEGCKCLWNRILVTKSSTFISKNSNIEDAQYAVQPEDFAVLLINNTNFLNNFVSIYKPTSTINTLPSSFSMPAINFFGNSFTTDNRGLKTPFAGIIGTTVVTNQSANGTGLPIRVLPQRRGVALAGIYVNDVVLLDLESNRSNTAEYNQFSNMMAGIVAIGVSTTQFNSCTFNNIRSSSAYNPSTSNTIEWQGTGVYAFSRSLFRGRNSLRAVSNSTNPLFSTFSNCDNGIIARGIHLQATRQSMANIFGIGISSFFGTNCIINVENNNIETRNIGVAMFFNDPTQNLDIQRNNITVTNGANNSTGFSCGIYVVENRNAHPLNINGNQVNCRNGNVGIYVTGNTKGIIQQNDVVLSGRTPIINSSRAGIAAQQTSTILSCNNVNGTNNENMPNVYGIYGVAVDGIWACNTVDRTYGGIRFEQRNQIRLEGNYFRKHYNDLWLDQTASIGTQTDHGNIWIDRTMPSNGGFEARLDNPTLARVLASQFFVDNTAPNIGDLMPNSINAPVQSQVWFNSQATNSVTYDCNALPSVCGRVVLRPLAVDNRDMAVATNSFIAYNATDLYQNKKGLYKKLADRPALVAADPALQNFQMQNSTSTVGQFEAVAEQTLVALALDSLDSLHIDSFHYQCNGFIDSLIVCDSIINDNPTDTTAIRLQAAIATNLGYYIAQEQLLSSQKEQQKQLNLQQTAVSNNNNISTVANYEDIEKTINAIYFDVVAKGNTNFDATQLQTLQDIAAQCPEEVGAVIFQARAMLSLVQTVDMLDKSGCDNSGNNGNGNGNGNAHKSQHISSDNDNTENNNIFNIYPNPAQNDITVSFLNPENEIAKISIFNSLGQLLMSEEFAGANISLSIAALPAGSYTCQVQLSYQVQTKQFVIIK